MHQNSAAAFTSFTQPPFYSHAATAGLATANNGRRSFQRFPDLQSRVWASSVDAGRKGADVGSRAEATHGTIILASMRQVSDSSCRRFSDSCSNYTLPPPETKGGGEKPHLLSHLQNFSSDAWKKNIPLFRGKPLFSLLRFEWIDLKCSRCEYKSSVKLDFTIA